MIEEILALSWKIIFLFGLKAISAWMVAYLIIVGIPTLILSFIQEAVGE